MMQTKPCIRQNVLQNFAVRFFYICEGDEKQILQLANEGHFVQEAVEISTAKC